MLDREAELSAFKRVNLSVIASNYGYEIVRAKSTKHSVLMASGNDKIIISQAKGGHYVYCSVTDPGSQGSVIDFVQKVVRPGCTLGEVRVELRPYIHSGYVAELQTKHAGRYAPEIRPIETDLMGVAARYSRFDPIAQPNDFLCNVRGIPFEVLQSDRLRGRLRHCPRRGSVVFPHLGSPDQHASQERCLTGYEIKGPGLSMFSKGGRKGLFISAGFPKDQQLVVGEAGLDAISYLVARGDHGTRVASIAGKMNPDQPALLESALKHLGEGECIAAFDNDKGGDELTERLHAISTAYSKDSVVFKEDRPKARGADWNQVVIDEAQLAGHIQKAGPSLGR